MLQRCKSARAIWEASYGNPGWIINYCKDLLEEASSKKLPKIDKKTVSSYVSSAGGGESFEGVTQEDTDDDFLEDAEKI